MQTVLLGLIGSGKTSLFNRITNSDEVVKSGGASVTMNVFMKSAAYGRVPFSVLDTPGFGSLIKKIEHAAGIVAALSEGPLNRIIIVQKFDRTDLMKQNFMKVASPVWRFKPLITLLVTHWDLCFTHEMEKNMNEIKQTFSKMNINSFIFTTKSESGESICNKILVELQSTKAETVQLVESEYSTQFDVVEFQDDLEVEINNSKADLETLFRSKAITIQNYIKSFDPNSSVLSDIMHTLTLESRNLAEQTLVQFEKQNWDLCQQMVDQGSQFMFLLHSLLKKSMEKDLQNVAKCAQEKLKGNGGHCFNYIKKCPFCGLIWMKVQGCDMQTYCGAIPSADQLMQQSAPKKWEVIWEKNKIKEVKFNDHQYIQKPLKQQQIIDVRFIKTIGNEQYQVGKTGCKNIIRWSEMQSLTQGEMSELVDPGLLDYFCSQDKTIEAQMKESQKPFQEQMELAIKKQKQNIIRA